MIENEYLAELIRRDNEIIYFKEKYKKTSEELEKTSEELENERKLREEKEKMILDLAKTMKENGIPVETIMKKTKLLREEVEKL